MDVSIIIPTHNHAQSLKKTLESMNTLSIPENIECEVIIINNQCTDRTDDVVRNFHSKIPLKYLKELALGVSKARNKGLQEASGKLLVFTDDDIQVGTQWLVSYWQEYQKKPCGYYFGGPIVSKFESQKIDEELMAYAPFSVRGLNWGNENRELTDNEMFIGPNFAFPRYFIEEAGPFSASFGLNAENALVGSGSETELMTRFRDKGFKAYYVAEAAVVQFVPKEKSGWRHIMGRKTSYGYEVARLKEKEIKGPFLFGVPRWVYKDYCVQCMKYWFQRLTGKKAYKTYARMKYTQGFYYGCKDRQRNGYYSHG